MFARLLLRMRLRRRIVRVGDGDALVWDARVDGAVEHNVLVNTARAVVHLAQLELWADVDAALYRVNRRLCSDRKCSETIVGGSRGRGPTLSSNPSGVSATRGDGL